MAKSYSEKLKDPRWQRRRLEIMERDGWKCVMCKRKNQTLHVHHVAYLRGVDPWEHPRRGLISLCEKCHDKAGKIDDEYKRILCDMGAYAIDHMRAVIDEAAAEKAEIDEARKWAAEQEKKNPAKFSGGNKRGWK